MADCTDYPTPEDSKRFKNNAGSIDEFVTSDSDTFVDQDGGEHLTVTGIGTLAENQRDQFDTTFQAQFTYAKIGNISDYVGDSLPESDKLNSYQFPDDSDKWYGPIQSQIFPITIPVDPTVTGSGWALTTAATQGWVADTVRNPNLLSNHNFLVPSPDPITHPSVTPTDYVAGTQVFSGVFVESDIEGLTYINGRVKWTNASGIIYLSVTNSNGLEYVTEFTASVADFDGKPRTRGVSFALVGDEYRVSVGINALEDAGGSETLLGSVKLEEGSTATRHQVYQVQTDFINVASMKMNAAGLTVGSRATTSTYKGGDKGGAAYLIVTKSDHDLTRGTSSIDGLWDHDLGAGKVAIYIKSGEFAYIEQAGVYPNEDPVQAIRTGVQSKYFKKIKLEAEQEYPISVNWPNVGGFKTPISLNGVYQSLIGENTILQLETNDLDGYNIVSNTGIECEVGGLIIRGDKDTHTGTTGEFGMGVANRGSIKAYMHDLLIENCWGDGWYEANLNGGNTRTLDTRAENITVNNCRRNAWSLVSAKGLRAENIELKDTSGAAPQTGLDIEPNTIADDLEDIIIDGINTSGNVAGGITLYLGGWSAAGTTSKSLGVTIKNHVSKDEIFPFVATRLFYESGDALLSGHCTLIDPTSIRSTNGGYFMRDWSATHPIVVSLIRPKLIDGNTSQGSASLDNAAFASYRLVSDLGTDTSQGGFNIESPVIEYTTNTYGPFASLYVHNNYKVPTVPNYDTSGFYVKGKAKALGSRVELPPSYMQGEFDIDFSEVEITQSITVGLTSSTSASFGRFKLNSQVDRTISVTNVAAETQPVEFMSTSNNWILNPVPGGSFVLNGSTLNQDQQVRTSNSYDVVYFKILFSNLSTTYLESIPSNGLVVV